MIVLDASAALELLLNTTIGAKVADNIFANQETLHAPHLVDLEIAQVLRRFVLKGQIEEERALEVFDDFTDLGVTRYPHQMLLSRIWSLKDNVTAYDAAYLSLAVELDARVVTCDAALKTVPGFKSRVAVIG